MSVIKSKRGTSEAEFIHTAAELVSFTIKQCNKITKRHTFDVRMKIVGLAWDVYNNVKDANDRYPVNQHEVQTRRDLFLNARSALDTLVGAIRITEEFIPIDSKTMLKWMAMIDTEFKLINAILKKDRERYKNIV